MRREPREYRLTLLEASSHGPALTLSGSGLMFSAPHADGSYVLLAPNKLSLREQALRSLSKLPPFSPVLTKLLATLAQEDVSFAKLADLIEKDTVLAGNVLKLVNSAAFGR